MKKFEDKSKNVKIAYIGGGSRGWAWGLMSDLAVCEKLCGEIALYDIDYEAAYHNEIIGNQVKDVKGCKSAWRYRAVSTIKEALTGADFVVISIQPATFKRWVLMFIRQRSMGFTNPLEIQRVREELSAHCARFLCMR